MSEANFGTQCKTNKKEEKNKGLVNKQKKEGRSITKPNAVKKKKNCTREWVKEKKKSGKFSRMHTMHGHRL